MLSKRASFSRQSQEPEPRTVPNDNPDHAPRLSEQPKRLREEASVSFIPSTRFDLVKDVKVFLREVNQPQYPYQITVVLEDASLGRLGYYDLSYDKIDEAKTEYSTIIDAVRNVREHIEFEQRSSIEIEKLIRHEVDEVLKYAVNFDSTYTKKSSPHKRSVRRLSST